MSRQHPRVSLVVPCRNEVYFLAACVESLLDTTYPLDRLEILVIDGMSTDGTRDVAERLAEAHPFIRLIDNPKRTNPAGMNIGIRSARGEVILRADAHCTYAPGYIDSCVWLLRVSPADNVGGVVEARPGRNTRVAKAIALVDGHPLGSGNSPIRSRRSGYRWGDTTTFGCYWRRTFDEIGFYNEKLVRNSDLDLNARLSAVGGRILVAPEVVVRYFPRSNLPDYIGHNWADGYWTFYGLALGGKTVRRRHLAPPLALLAVLVALGVASMAPIGWSVVVAMLLAAVGLVVVSSAQLAHRGRDATMLAVIPMIFVIRHLTRAVASWWGLFMAILRPPEEGELTDARGTTTGS